MNPLIILKQVENTKDVESIARLCDETFFDQSANDEPHIHESYRKSIHKLHNRLTILLTKRFPNARLSIYGSCLSDLSLGKGSDVDLSLFLPEVDKLKTDFEQGNLDAHVYEREMKRFVYQVNHKLNALKHEFRGMQPITRARVPVVKGTYNYADNPYTVDGSIK
jgi:DNA polymerase sigma